ncbi:cellulose biosynthesis cyclic di-GMP-binding regulatory protein BcsB [Herbaspirillum sp. LeCh32-8]|uniref:cellulose biosynthesis cyclic di-GMP-binding regulatory protein BcsB n=1 Tax=Herbaspirillum sp. LeCh32-8 TaxID=2821356 RepID=UPI001AE9652C|nr:cellulose biosynthesis cyclic di-GMP-binding regulatory protein BcsB [Herbaspirillum sp. LeCh32-8]MBP0599859.1 cellulose biosynthesis cyclic di-GMP-binding regulatory protein BcsB [Herbaspirillum sp. LeCh32-8]
MTSPRSLNRLTRLPLHALLGVLFAALLTAGLQLPAQAQPAAAPKVATPATTAATATAGATGSREIRLADLGAQPGPMRLTRLDGAAMLSLPLSRRENIKSAALHLVATNSIALNNRSQLVVRLNGHSIAQLQLSARQPEITADIRLPAELLKPGYNQLIFRVAQHSQDTQCEDPNAPELWTEIDTTQSTLRLQSELRSVAPMLSDLGDLFDPKQHAQQKFNIITARHPDSDDALSAGGMVAQGIGLKLRYVLPTITQVDAQAGSGAGPVPGLQLTGLGNADNVLVGTLDQLKPFIDPKVAAQIKGSFLGVYPMPDGQHVLLIVSGADERQVRQAAQVFAWQNLEFPQQAQWNITDFTPPELPNYLPQANIATEGVYSFKQLGFSTAPITTVTPAEVNVNLPPDVYAQEDAQMEFHLNFSQGAMLNSSIVINLYLNDVFQRAISVEDRQGGFYDNYRLTLPLRHFKPGNNVLSFRPIIMPNRQCDQTGPLNMSLFDDSSVKVPYIYRFAQLPDLSRFSSSAFPYVTRSDGSELALVVAGRDSATIGAAWTLLAKVAQKQSVPLGAAQVTFGKPTVNRHALIVGALGNLPRELLKEAPWTLEQNLSFAGASIPVARPGKESNWFRQQFQTIAGTNRSNADSTYLNTAVTGDARLNKQLVVMQFRSAALDDHTATVFASATPEELQQGVAQLVSPAYWNNIAGDVSLLSFGKPEVATQRIGPTYDEGTIGKAEYLGYIASKYPWMWYGVVMFALLVLAWLCWRQLRAHLRRRQGKRNADI